MCVYLHLKFVVFNLCSFYNWPLCCETITLIDNNNNNKVITDIHSLYTGKQDVSDITS